MLPETKPILFKTDLEVIEIIEVCDAHFGNECFNYSKWNNLQRYILEKPNRFIIWNGDLMENAVPGSKSDPLTQTLSPQEQQDMVTECFKKFKDRTLAIVDGNHESNRSIRLAGLYPLYTSACIAGISERYRSAYAVLDISMGHGRQGFPNRKHKFIGYICHRGKNMKQFATTDMLEGFDFVVVAHDHEPYDHSRGKIIYDSRTKTLMYKDIEMVDNGSCMFYGGYAARDGSRVKSDKLYKIICYGDGREKRIETLGFHV